MRFGGDGEGVARGGIVAASRGCEVEVWVRSEEGCHEGGDRLRTSLVCLENVVEEDQRPELFVGSPLISAGSVGSSREERFRPGPQGTDKSNGCS